MRWSVRRCLPLVLALVALACQPVDSDLDLAEPSPSGGIAPHIGALQQHLEAAASRWQDHPRMAELVVEVDEQRRAVRAAATYVAAGAEEVLSVSLDAEGVDQYRQPLREYGVGPLPVAAVEEIPRLPERVLDPGALLEAAAGARSECGSTATPTRVIYATGAPAAWQGTSWRTAPSWGGIVVAGDEAVAVSPTTGDPVPPGCIS